MENDLTKNRCEACRIDAPVLTDKEIEQLITGLNRQFLHATTLGFNHPRNNKRMNFYSKLPSDLEKILKKLIKAE